MQVQSIVSTAKREPRPKPVLRSTEKTIWRIILRSVLWATVFIGMVLAWHQVDQFLIREPRFILTPPPEPGDDSPNLHIEGLKHTPKAAILKLFQDDFGKSIYMLSPSERRRDLLSIGWIKDASVMRIWPNQIRVHLVERVPLFYVQVDGDGKLMLIDEDGVLMDPGKGKYNLPIVSGIRAESKEADRKVRVQRVARLLKDTKAVSDMFSEIDASDPENLKITQKIGDRAITVLLGHENYRQRLENFYNHFDQIRDRNPNRLKFDLRLDDRITAVGGPNE